MRRLLYFAALSLVLALVAVPAIGDPGEPTAPVTNVTLNLGNYASGLELACETPVPETMTWDQLLASDADRFPASKMRIEPFVNVAALPSEHWRSRLIYEKVERGNGGKIVFRDWDYYDYRHQNVPPSGRRNWELAQIAKNFVGLQGWWRISIDVTGDESGNHFAPSCVFEVVAPPAG